MVVGPERSINGKSEDTVRGNAPLSTLERRSNSYGHHSSRHSRSTTMRHHNHHQRIREGDHTPEEFKKAKPPIVDGEMKKSKDSKA